MKGDEILDLLESNPTAENVQSAISWLKKHKPTNKVAQKILQKLIRRPEFESELDWLGNWISLGPWTALRSTAWNVQLPAVYDWLIEFLVRHPEHPQCGELWSAMLMTYPDQRIEVAAASWLESFGGLDRYTVEVAARLILRRKPSESELVKALNLLDEHPDDWLLLEALIQIVGDEQAVSLGIWYLQNSTKPLPGGWVAKALLIRDSQKYSPYVVDYVRKHWEHKGLASAFEEIANQIAEPIYPLILQWIEEHPRKPIVCAGLLQYLLAYSANQPIADYSWTWIKSRCAKPEAIRTLEQLLLANPDIRVPQESIQFAVGWLRSNKGHEHWKDIAGAVLEILPDTDVSQYAIVWLDEASPEEYPAILLAAIENSNHEGVVARAGAWYEKFSGDDFSVKVLTALLLNSADSKTVAWAKERLKVIRLDESYWRLLTALTLTADVDAVDMAKNLLNETFVDQNSRVHYEARGMLIRALLTVTSTDDEAHQHAEKWLRRIPGWWQKKVLEAVGADFRRARMDGMI